MGKGGGQKMGNLVGHEEKDQVSPDMTRQRQMASLHLAIFSFKPARLKGP